MFRTRRVLVAFAASAVALGSASLGAQAPAALKVGDMAPDFTLTAVTAAGPMAAPFTLSKHRGETVVLAFFPKARTSGCTVQMESYRDQYAQLFKGGDKVTLIGISNDPDTALISWAKDAKFPFAFGSDVSRAVGKAYGVSDGQTGYHKRHLYVIDPTGRISYVATPFNQMSADAYTQLGAAVAQAASAK
jgi:peroxiredoxin Q/BCP